ncbi:GNAT superfamily N-acetyltransferase [Paenarthrobacter nitroguajacolicus]|uniref:GNAT family N-acetyltransferase n=1 Tax=Paenarthrobacter nitroguajacolicus TaxID=211146 RepID=UPI00285DC25B|nr:GNAT family N-acetyltransferase [Paenarthrobacter nitroguajacolicus]MDR6988481.1 GNAT superfamily N-acetyltransferase [Paenarthrobacter nitroguajacolicus]
MTYLLSPDKDRVDRDWLWARLSTKVYWAKWRTRADVEAQLDNAWRIIGAYDSETGAMVGYARAFSDGVALAYLADVYVEEFARGQSLGKAMVREMIDAGPGANFRWMLHTSDAHGLYEQFGFVEPDARYLERPETR